MGSFLSNRALPLRLTSLAIALLVFTFVVLPIGAMLARSLVVSGPAPLADLARMTEAAIALLPEDGRDAALDRWVAASDPRQRMEAIAAALALSEQAVPWDRTAAFDIQIAAAEATLAALPAEGRGAVEERIPLATVMLHRRIPLAFQVKDALGEEAFDALRSGVHDRYGWDHYLAVVQEPRLRHAAANSLSLAAVTTPVTLALAFLIAFGINRGGVAGAGIARWAVFIPLVSPPVIIATATVLLFGRSGLITHGLLDQGLGWIDASTQNMYGRAGVILAQVLSYLPAAYIVLDNVLSKQDGRLEEAAAIQGAGPARTFWHITLPLCQPGLIRAATLVFIMSLTDFGNPMVIGKDIPVLAGVLYDEMIGFHNTAFASAIAVWLIVPVLLVHALLGRIGRRKRFETAEFAGAAGLPLPRNWRRILTLVTWTVIGFTAVVYLTILYGSLVSVWGRDFSLTLAHYLPGQSVAGFVSDTAALDPLWVSLRVVVISAPLAGLLSVIIAFLAERARGPLNAATAFAVMLPAILPGAVFGIGYIVAFNNPLGIPALSLNGTTGILVLNILFGHLYVGVLAGRAMLRRLDRSVDEAAEILGASLRQRFTHVTLPMMRRAAFLGTIYVFVDGLCTFSAVVFLQPPGTDLASVAIFKSASNTYYGQACAASVAIMAGSALAMLAVRLLSRHGPRALRDMEFRRMETAP